MEKKIHSGRKQMSRGARTFFSSFFLPSISPSKLPRVHFGYMLVRTLHVHVCGVKLLSKRIK